AIPPTETPIPSMTSPEVNPSVAPSADTVAPGATAALAGADLAPVATAAPGTTPSPEATGVSTLPRELPTQAP
ncbi:unnamed protein product, partial [Ectocarpus sp. 8 AP-2014]